MNNTKKNIILSLILLLIPVAVALATDNDNNKYSALGLTQILINLQRSLPAVVRFIVACSYVMGLTLIFSGVHELRMYGQARTMMPLDASLTGPLGKMAIGALLMFFPGLVDVTVYTLWNQSVYNIQAYFTPGSESYANQIFNAVIALVRVFGYISVLHGFILMSRAVRKGAAPGQFGKGIMHLVGGVLAINIVGTVNVIMATFFQA